jgi:hypothetical protein
MTIVPGGEVYLDPDPRISLFSDPLKIQKIHALFKRKDKRS